MSRRRAHIAHDDPDRVLSRAAAAELWGGLSVEVFEREVVGKGLLRLYPLYPGSREMVTTRRELLEARDRAWRQAKSTRKTTRFTQPASPADFKRRMDERWRDA